ncbi:MAG: VOC family protein [Jatrophihabitantaceae bacterium]
MTATRTHITGVRAISIPFNDQDAAVRFYVHALGFTVLRDSPTPNGGRWIELTPGQDNPRHHARTGGRTSPAEQSASDSPPTTPRPSTAVLAAASADTDEILRWPGVPAMFAFRHPDGNAFSITETA